MHANRQLWHCFWMFKYGSKHDVHIMDFASEPVSKVIYNQAGIWSLFLSNITEGLLESSGILAQIQGSIFCFFQDSARTSFSNASCIQPVTIRLTLRNPECAFKYECCCTASQRSTCSYHVQKELSQIIAGWCVRADSSLCLDKRNTKSFWL